MPYRGSCADTGLQSLNVRSSTMTRISNVNALIRLKAILASEGVRASICYLNSLTGHRFSAVFRFDGNQLQSLIYFDRLNPQVLSCPEIPVQASYCYFVREANAPFTTEDAQHDDRLGDHPQRHIVQSYCGTPLFDEDGELLGSICHFDFSPNQTTQVDLELLECMASILQKRL